ncbi:hypothetical protein [Parafilimonas terrae]|jgi:hypothetical protein|uniref:Uncharacterized protein n=1 Tax=Parafilimonas terrae TaxID=1465490 RepID=A0A1I5S4T8_9BACT|nr:hypothetical protein [Parafilimonas terrae]SFP65276.1 hypothetical protein SAMN05444277_101564 [Parafilimonas terrae]
MNELQKDFITAAVLYSGFFHLPARENGKWYGYLHRDGTVAQTAKGNLFKGAGMVLHAGLAAHLMK